MKSILKNKKGFTLIELMVVIVILLILAAIAIPSFSKLVDKANETAAISEAKSVYMLAEFEAELANAEGKNEADVLTEKWADICDQAGIDESLASFSFTVSDNELVVVYYFDDGNQCVIMPDGTVSVVVH